MRLRATMLYDAPLGSYERAQQGSACLGWGRGGGGRGEPLENVASRLGSGELPRRWPGEGWGREGDA